MKIFISTLGCKVNQYESQAILEMFIKAGFEKALGPKSADVLIINSCTVTEESNKKVRKMLHKYRRVNPKAIIVLTGCMVQAFPEKVKYLSQADIIAGNIGKESILEKVKDYLENPQKIIDIKPYKNGCTFENLTIQSFNDRTRAFLKIEDGCDRFCSYCIIPFARGRVRSKTLENIKKEIEALTENSYQEIVLVGINLSSYGQDLNVNICNAIELVSSYSAIKRIRLGSLEPEKMELEVVKRLAKIEKLCPQFHISLQSGCNETLKRMNRNYTVSDYEEIVKNLRAYFKNAAITTDIMVGFAGETDEEFEKTLDFVKKIKFAKIHVFPYSIRPGTKAAEFKNQVAPEVKNERIKKMLHFAAQLNREFLKEQIGNIDEVLFERRHGRDFFEGYTKNYVPVLVKTQEDLSAKILKVKLTEANDKYCLGELL
ncbi:MAG: tRNA (N(6)-L-threonylcarbamoyladenosine(37)-C(2))-methylthiotransferase MtaB [Clostridia bacterium]|nr:tRNA (N(6)-L-threonylcarbamoyladenosine(37)-C(2))-methylthiotransferase MtaB [Clostridia bacterium]